MKTRGCYFHETREKLKNDDKCFNIQVMDQNGTFFRKGIK